MIQLFKKNEVKSLLGISLYHRVLYGNKNEPWENFDYLVKLYLSKKLDFMPFIYLDVGNLFEQLILQNIAIVQKYFGHFTPCPACHLFLHMMRIPIANFYNIQKIITGERESHNSVEKLNQISEILDLYKSLLKKHQIELVQPLRKIKNDVNIYRILGHQWRNNINTLNCSFSKNYYDENGKIPFELDRIKYSITDFYFPLFSSVINFINTQHKEPDEHWFREKILKVIDTFKDKM